MFLDPSTKQVLLAWGKTTAMGYSIPGWTANGIVTEPVVFQGGPTVALTDKEISAPPQIARSIRGYPPGWHLGWHKKRKTNIMRIQDTLNW